MNRPDNLATLAVLVQGPKDRQLLTQLFADAGHAVVEPSHEAPEVHADLVLMDEQLGVRALDRVHQWRQRQRPLQLPVLVLLSRGADARPWLRAQCDDVLRLPIAKEELLARIDAFVRIRRASEQAEAESERRFQVAFEHAPVGIAHCGWDGAVLRANPQMSRLLGVPAEALLGAALDGLLGCPFVGPEPGTRAGAEPLRERTIRHQRPDATDVWLRVSDWRTEDPTRAALHRVVILKDVTAVKNAEMRLNNLNAELEEQVSKRTAELRALNAELDAFTSSVSHDLRAPVRTIQGFAELLVEELGGKLEGRAAHLLLRLRGASTRMGSMIDGLLTLAQSSRAAIQGVRVDLAAFAREILEELAAEAPTRPVETHVGADLFAVGDPRLLRLVLQNLLGNAWKYSAHTVRARIVFDRNPDGSFFIRDNGAGFDPERVDQLFTPFHRLHNESEFPGAGVGLATVHRIVSRHGGTIRAEGALGQGATFTFTLPA